MTKRLREDIDYEEYATASDELLHEEDTAAAADEWTLDDDPYDFLEFFKFWKYDIVYCFRGWKASSDASSTATQYENPFLFRKDFHGENLGRHQLFSDFIHDSSDNPVFLARRRGRDEQLLFVWYNTSDSRRQYDSWRYNTPNTPLTHLSNILFGIDRCHKWEGKECNSVRRYDLFAEVDESGGTKNAFALLELSANSVQVKHLDSSSFCCEAHYLLSKAVCVHADCIRHGVPIELPYSAALTWFSIVSGFCQDDVTLLTGGSVLSAALPSEFSYFVRKLNCSSLSTTPWDLYCIVDKYRLNSQLLKRVVRVLQQHNWEIDCKKDALEVFWRSFRRFLCALPYMHRSAVIYSALQSDNRNQFSLPFRIGFFRLYLRYMQCRRQVVVAALRRVPRGIANYVLSFSEQMPVNWDFQDLLNDDSASSREILNITATIFATPVTDRGSGCNDFVPFHYLLW